MPIAHSTRISSSLSLNGAVITSWMRSAAASASSIPRRSDTRIAEFVAAGARQHVAARSAEISRRAKVISSSSPARLPMLSLIRAEAQHVDHQHRMLEVAGSLVSPILLDRFGKGQAVGQAGQAVAQHFGAQRPLGLRLRRCGRRR